MAHSLARMVMYQKIKELMGAGLSIAQVARQLDVSRPTIYKYLALDEAAFLTWNQHWKRRPLKLEAYELAIRQRLESYPDLSAAQIEDFLKELQPDLQVSPKTVWLFVDHN